MSASMRARARTAPQRRPPGYWAGRALTFWLPLGVFIVVLLFPFYWMALTSLKSNRELYDVRADPFVVTRPTLAHYQFLFADTLFLRWLVNTMVIAVAATAIALGCGILAGYALARLRFRGASLLALAIFVTYLVPQTLLFLPLGDVVNRFHLRDSLWSLILTYPTFLIPFCTWLLMGYFKTIPREIEEAALIDGASRLQAMWRVGVPLALPGILSAGIFAFTLSWNEFIYALVFLSSSAQKTLPVGVTSELIRGDAFYWGELMAGALLASVPVALIYSLFVERYVAGLAAGAVKG
ncbi:MAG TPA: carbohydrate ABC transporter permease [Thermomicrobiales bacterium]|nr:carbohydrate ABC transporter permease [Thermomicrobiales bacterium]